MNDEFGKEAMLDLFIFETLQLLENLEQEILNSEKSQELEESIPEIFRTMHTIKGSAAMMHYNHISELAHAIEDLFFFLREEKPSKIDTSRIIDLVLEGIDFIKNEIAKIEKRESESGDGSSLIIAIKEYLRELEEATPNQKSRPAETKKQAPASEKPSPAKDDLPMYEAVVKFEPGCGFEDVQAFAVINNLKKSVTGIKSWPDEFIDNEEGIKIIQEEGLKLTFNSGLGLDQLHTLLGKNAFVSEVKVKQQSNEATEKPPAKIKKEIVLDDPVGPIPEEKATKKSGSEGKVSNNSGNGTVKQSLISVSVNKLDVLMDLVGELVIAEAMVTQNPELEGLPLDNYFKAARQLRKITNELQDVVMAIRMVPLAATFQKMHRIVRDMSRKLAKEVQLEIIGEETEVDKNIIEHISDPLMHLIRNAMDHGIETLEERRQKNKPEIGKITLEAKNAGNDVLIQVKDDGCGLNREKILAKAKTRGLVNKPDHELTDREVYAFTLLPGFSTKEKVTEFSGRGVGMDVVTRSIEEIGGTVLIDSTPDVGTVITLKIPLTLAIINGMTVRVGTSQYTVPTTSIRESFRMKPEDLIIDPDGNEMILIRGECYPVIRLHQLFKIQTNVTEIDQGIVMMVENNSKGLCLFAEELLGEQQVVVKALPRYIKKIKGIAGCTLLGDGSISLILDVAGLIQLTTNS